MSFYLYMHHGRLDPSTGGTDEEGNEVDDWGFEGPNLVGVIGTHVTYGELRVFFGDATAARVAKALTGWADGNGDEDLCVNFSEDNSCLRRFNAARGRDEFFGDWGLAMSMRHMTARAESEAHAQNALRTASNIAVEHVPLSGAAWTPR